MDLPSLPTSWPTDTVGIGSPFPIPTPPVITPPVAEPTMPEGTPVEEEPEQVGWFLALLKLAADWIIEEIVRPALEGAVWLLKWIRAELRYWTYEAIKAITELTETTEGLIVVLVAVVALSIFVPQVAAAFMETTVGLFLAKMVEWTKEKVGNILEAIHFVDLVSIHQALMVIWPTWREMWTPFADAVSALSEQLGQGTGYIHAWLSVAHGLSMVGTSLLGMDPKLGELRAVEDSQTFMANLDKKFREYAHDPGLIVTDMIEDLYIPYATEIRDTQGATLEAIQDGRQQILNTNMALTELDRAFQSVIDNTLPEFQEQMEENLKGIREVIDQYSDWITVDILPYFDYTISILDERQRALEQANAVAMAKLDNPIEIFLSLQHSDPELALLTFEYLQAQMNEVENRENVEPLVQMFPVITTATEQLIENMEAIPVSEAMAVEPVGYPVLDENPAQNTRDWFVGEF